MTIAEDDVQSSARPRIRVRLVLASLLVVHAGLLAWAAATDAPTWDEPGHLVAGLAHWELGTHSLYRVNPPLVRALAALPVLAADPVRNWARIDHDPARRAEYDVAFDFVAANGKRTFRLVTLARWAVIPLSLVGGLACFAWARELRGDGAGLLAATLWCFSPNVLGHGHLITTDVAAAALGALACFAFWRWLIAPGWLSATLAGGALGLAELTKFTWLFLFVLLPLLWLACRLPKWRHASRRREALQLGAILLLALLVLNLGYRFDGTGRRLGDFEFVSSSLSGRETPPGQAPAVGNRFSQSWLGALPVPVPAELVQGLDRQRRDLEGEMRSYLRGRFQFGGWWHYYVYGLAVKVPLGTWLLGFLALGLTAWGRLSSTGWRDELCLLGPAAATLVLVSSQTGAGQHLRYVFPLLPFVFIAISRVADRAVLARRPCAVAVGVAGLWAVGSSLLVQPHGLAYFNEAAGGPRGGPSHLIGSNIDWGQDLLRLRRWLDENDDARPLRLAYFGSIDPVHAGIDYALPPSGDPARPGDGPVAGLHAVSVNFLHGYRFFAFDGKGGMEFVRAGDYRHLRDLEPVGRAGWSILIFDLDEQLARRLRDERDQAVEIPRTSAHPR